MKKLRSGPSGYLFDQSQGVALVSGDVSAASSNTEAIREALALLKLRGGGTLLLADGDFYIDPLGPDLPCIWVDFGNCKIQGTGPKCKLIVSNDQDVPILVASNPDLSIAPTGAVIDGIEISGVHVVGTGNYVNYPLAYGRGILLRNVTHANIHNNYVTDMSMIGICTEGACGWINITSNICTDCAYSSINFNGRAYNSSISLNICSGSTGDVNAVAIQADGPCSITGNTVFGGGVFGGGILWGEGDWDGIGTITSNLVTHCSFGIKAFYHGACNVSSNIIINCFGLGGGILLYGGVIPGFTVPVSNAIASANIIVNCAPYQIEVTAKNTLLIGNECWFIAAPVNVAPPGSPDYIDGAVTVDTAIVIRTTGVSAIGNVVDGAIRGLSYMLGQPPGSIGMNTFIGCTNNVVQESPALYQYTPIPDFERSPLGVSYRTRMSSGSRPVTGFFELGSVWEDSTPVRDGISTERVRVAFQTTLTVQANAGDTVLTTAAASTLLNESVVGVVLDNGAIHWSLVTASAGTSTTLATAIPVGRFAPIGAILYGNSWVPDAPMATVAFLMNKPTGTTGLVGSPGASTVLPLLTEDLSNGPHYHQGPVYNFAAGRSITMRVVAKASGRNFIALNDGGANSVFFNLSSGVVHSVLGSAVAEMKSMGGGVYVCTMTCIWSVNQGYIYLSPDGAAVSYIGTGASVFILSADTY